MDKVVWTKFIKYLKPYIWHQIALISLLFSGTVCSLASPYALKIIVDDVFPAKNYSLLYKVLGVLFLIYVLRILMYYVTDLLYTLVSNKIYIQISSDLFSHLLKLPISFYANQDVGEIVHRLNNEIAAIHTGLSSSVISFISNAFTILLLVSAMCYLNMRLFLPILLFYPLLYLVLRYFDPKLKNVVERIRTSESTLLGIFTEKILNIRLIKRLFNYDFEHQSMNEKLRNLTSLYQKEIVLSSASRNISLLILSIIPLVVLGWGGNLVLNEAMSIGALIAFMQYASRLHDPFRSLVNLYVELIGLSVSLQRLNEYFEIPIQYDLPEKNYHSIDLVNSVEFDSVSYSLNGERILDNINLKMQSGAVYALVGASGSGKTTIINLLSKLLSPTEGLIKINGHNLSDISLKNWTSKMAICDQKAEVFNTSLLCNATYGLQEYDKEELTKLVSDLNLKTSEADNIQILDKSVGIAGGNLSGGQNQKIGLIRMLLSKREIVILDEATAAIDSIGEKIVFEKVKNSPQIRILLIITHQLSTLKQSDIIFCIDQGKVIEQGNFQELINHEGRFYNLYKDQLN